MAMTTRTIRATFLNFFASKGHTIVSSAPLVVKNDPTLMFNNAGMNQFKDYFLGTQKPPNLRVANTQKCLRVSGKHNDLEDVGLDTYHHTMFEMLGNWSFGDYFKKEAVAWAWELLTEVYGLEPDRLYATVFEGDDNEDLPFDQEAQQHWENYLPQERILRGSKKDNFWEMGASGPCGPCSEVHIDLRPESERAEIDGKVLVNQDHPLVVEIWNLVFIEFNRQADGTLESLPQKHIDTGLGLERLAMALQGKASNYDTDLFQDLIRAISGLCEYTYGKKEQTDIALRVVADHCRAIAFAIADGQLPSNNKAGYVIRRILRRAVRYGYTFLDFRNPFICKLVDVLEANFQHIFPEIKTQKAFIQRVIEQEEGNFFKTLDKGLALLDQVFKALAQNKTEVEGVVAFKLYDTYGFPLDLTQLIAKEKGFKVDVEGFETCMRVQKDRSRKAAEVETGDWQILNPATKAYFKGYDTLTGTAQIMRFRTTKTKHKTIYHLVLDETPFYPEGGGQIGDRGTITIGTENIRVLNTQKENDLIIHQVDQLPHLLDQAALCEVDSKRRQLVTFNHSATHLLHAALRRILGRHVEQKGSLVNADLLRFDFSHFEKISRANLKSIEDLVNAKIRSAIPVLERRNVPYEKALEMGAMAIFGEKYGAEVRMISFEDSFSLELCGGTHVPNTHKIGFFKIISEGSVAAGVRRIQAFTNQKALDYIQEQLNLLENLKQHHKYPKDLEAHTLKILAENLASKKNLKKLEQSHLERLSLDLKAKIKHHQNYNTLIEQIDLIKSEHLKTLGLLLSRHIPTNLYCVLTSLIENQPYIMVVLSPDLAEVYDARQILNHLAKLIDGRGGGQKTLAIARGKDKTNLNPVLTAAKTLPIFKS